MSARMVRREKDSPWHYASNGDCHTRPQSTLNPRHRRRHETRNVSLFCRNLLHSSFPHNVTSSSSLLGASTLSRLRFFSSENDSSNENSKPVPETTLVDPVKKDVSVDVEDIHNKGNKTFFLFLFRIVLWKMDEKLV